MSTRIAVRLATVVTATLAGVALLVPAAGALPLPQGSLTLNDDLRPDNPIPDGEAEQRSDGSDYCFYLPGGVEDQALACAPTGNFHIPELDQDFVETP